MQIEPATAPPSPTRRRRKEARPAELIGAAIEVFAEKGFAAARLEDVARRAGVSKGTAYLYFPTKEALFKAAVQEVVVTGLAQGERALESWEGSSASLLRFMLERWAEVVRSREGGLFKLIVAEASNFPELAAWYQEQVCARGQRLMEAVLKRGVASGEFRPVDIEAVAQVAASPLAFRAVWTQSLGRFAGAPVTDERFNSSYFDLILAGLCGRDPVASSSRAATGD